MREIFHNSLIKAIYAILFLKNRCSVISISHCVENNLPKRLQYKSTVIYNGIDIHQNIDKKKSSDGLRLLFLGRVVPWKGCDTLIDIMNNLHIKHPNLKVTINFYGDTIYWSTSYRENLKTKIKKLELESLCTINNSVKDISSLFNTHDILVNASKDEPFGRVIAEAMAYKLPVIAFNSGAVSEIVDNNTGILIDYGDKDSFVKAITTIYKNRDLINELGKNGRKKCSENFNKTTQLKLIIKNINEILS